MFSGSKPRHDEYDAELRELERKTQQVKAHAAALQREREHAAALEQQRPVQRSYDGRMPLVSPTLLTSLVWSATKQDTSTYTPAFSPLMI